MENVTCRYPQYFTLEVLYMPFVVFCFSPNISSSHIVWNFFDQTIFLAFLTPLGLLNRFMAGHIIHNILRLHFSASLVVGNLAKFYPIGCNINILQFLEKCSLRIFSSCWLRRYCDENHILRILKNKIEFFFFFF